MFLASTSQNGLGIFSGKLLRIKEDFSSSDRIYPPPAVATIDRYVSGDRYGPRLYFTGGHTANLVIDEALRCSRQGIAAPDAAPTVSASAGSTPQVLYTRFYDEVTAERSPLSPGKSLTGGDTRTWSVLPTTVPNELTVLEGISNISAGNVTAAGVGATNYHILRPGDRVAGASTANRWGQIRTITSSTVATVDDAGLTVVADTLICKPVSRVSHVELWCSPNGGLPRFIMRVRIGTTDVVETTAVLALGEAEITSFIAMPLGRFNLIYNDRQLVAGVDKRPDTVFLSDIGFPERHAGLAFKTKYGENICGMLRYRDYVIVLCSGTAGGEIGASGSSYILQGYTQDDMTMSVLEPDLGGIGHHANKIVRGYAIIPNSKGVFAYNGAWHPISGDRRKEWSYRFVTNPLPYEDGLAAVNPNDDTYQFMPKDEPQYTTPEQIFNPRFWVADYSPLVSEAGGGLASPNWTDDDTGYSFASYLVPSGHKIGKFYRVTTSGDLYEEDTTRTVAYVGNAKIATAHLLMGDPGGAAREGKTLVRFWSYVISENSAWKVNVWAGEEGALPPEIGPGGVAQAVLPGYVDNVAASYLANGNFVPAQPNHYGVGVVHLNTVWQAQVTHVHQVAGQPISGRGFTFEYVFINPKNVRFIGLGGVWEPGPATRPIWSCEITG